MKVEGFRECTCMPATFLFFFSVKKSITFSFFSEKLFQSFPDFFFLSSKFLRFYWPNIELDIDDCILPCGENALCTNVGPNLRECVCKAGFFPSTPQRLTPDDKVGITCSGMLTPVPKN